jgi:hypothetical protein
MSVLRLSSGKFLVIDTIPITSEIKTELDHLTDSGALIDAVVATHSYHTLYFPAFHALYPSLRYYGTPRHLSVQPMIPWSGSVADDAVLKLWEPDVIMRIPDGAEFVNPPPENHFAGVFVFHRASRTIHIDDTISYFERAGCVLKLIGVKTGSMKFHSSLETVGLLRTPEAPMQFKAFIQAVINDWDFDYICTAHIGNKLGGAKEMLQETLNRYESTFQRIAARNADEQKRN